MAEITQPIPARLKNVAVGGHVAGVEDIYDDNKEKTQKQINAEVEQSLGSGGSVDTRIANAVNAENTRAQEAEQSLDGKIATEKSRAEGIENSQAERISTLEAAVGTGGSVDERITAEATAREAAVSAETTRAQAAEAQRYTKSETYNKEEVNGLVDTPHQEYVTVEVYSDLPATGSKDTIYRVSNYNGSTSQVDASVFSEYAWNGNQYVFLCVKSQIGEVFDISVYNNNAKYLELADALGIDGGHVPQSLRKGGMSIKFVQSSDSKYVQFRLMSDTFNTTPANWQGVDDKPTPGSNNLVKSSGVCADIINNIDILSKIGIDAISDTDAVQANLGNGTPGTAWANVSGNVSRLSVGADWVSYDNYVSCVGYNKVAYRCYGENGQTLLVFTTDEDVVIAHYTPNGDGCNIYDIPLYSTRIYVNKPSKNDYVDNSLILIKSVILDGYDGIKGKTITNSFNIRGIQESFLVKNALLSVAFPEKLNGAIGNSAWVGTVGSSLETILSDKFSRKLDYIPYSEGIVYLHQEVVSNQTPFVFTDDSNVVKGLAYPSVAASEMIITPPVGTTRIYWNVNTEINTSIDGVYLVIYQESSLAAMISKGGLIVIPEGTFEVTSTIQVPSNTKIVGTNGKTIIKAVGVDTLFDISGETENVKFEGLTFEGGLNYDGRIFIPTASDLQTEQTISQKPFVSSGADKYYYSNNGKIVSGSLSGWSIMAPVEYNGGNVVLHQTATPSQRILYCADEEGNILNSFTGDGTSWINASEINPNVKYLYWTAPTSVVPYISMFVKGDSSPENGIGLYIHGTSVKDIIIDNCIFKNFPFAGVRVYNTLQGGVYKDSVKLNLCRFQNNTNGIIFAERAEFATVVNCEFSHNQIGVWTCASNTNFGSCQISQNYGDGIVFVGGYENSVHTVVSNCEIVHNGYNAGNTGTIHETYDIAFIKTAAGIIITGCLIGIDGIRFFQAYGNLISSCQLFCPVYSDSHIGYNMIHNCMWRKHASLGTVINGDQTYLSLKNNRYTSGDYDNINNNV